LKIIPVNPIGITSISAAKLLIIGGEAVINWQAEGGEITGVSCFVKGKHLCCD